MEFYSQYGQDKWLYNNYFKNKTDGFFLEIGADDGIDKSNSYFFEKYMNWSGICIEPSKSRYKELEKNRNCILENVALSDDIKNVQFRDIKGYSEQLSGIVDDYHEKHIKRIETEALNKKNFGYDIYNMETDTLTNILKKHNIYHIDFCTIDTEGSEFNIIKGIDFDIIDINIILVENNYGEEDIKEYLKERGYAFLNKLNSDDVYKK